jgi:hypothetical protein
VSLPKSCLVAPFNAYRTVSDISFEKSSGGIDGPQDIESGRRAGCRTVGVLGGTPSRKRLEAVNPDVLIDSLAELPNIVDRWSDATI